MRKAILAIFTLTFVSLAGLANEPTKMLHMTMEVKESEGQEPISMTMNFPLGVFESVAPNLNQALENFDMEGQQIDIRQLWSEVRAAGPNEFVNISHNEGHVVVSTNETHVKIDIDANEEGKINITVPIQFLDMLLTGEGQLNVDELLARLENWEGDIVTVTGDKINGRVWVD